MKFRLQRKYFKEGYTIGNFYVDRELGGGLEFLFNMLEDKVRPQGVPKEYGKTAIPYGTYKVVVTESKRFGRKLPLLLNVPNFTGIRIHPGNTSADTEGCLLPGFNTEVGKVVKSTECFNRLFAMMHYSGQSEWQLEIV
ncbi:MAG: hypothetical protein HC896_00070 [Bacteroidales bacterium]|nr:hypothetical protein [Bacteroidales bacterium]